jgi:hypothetical protein
VSPVYRIALLCLVMACGPASRRAERADNSGGTGDEPDADAPADHQVSHDAIRNREADTAAPGDDAAPGDTQALDEAVSDEDGGGALIPDGGPDARGATTDAAAGASPCPGYKKGTHTQPGVAAATFCAAYAKRCGYQAAAPAFASLADCLATYDGSSTTAQTCRAGHLCEAIASTTTSGRSTNCQAAAHGPTCP